MKKSPTFALIFFSLFLTACGTGWSLDSLKNMKPAGTPFQNALAREYQDLAQSEADTYDWQNSSYFAKKGLSAAYGNDIQPENPERWDVPDETKLTLEEARTRLVNMLNDKNKRVSPERMAHAQMMYDCWVEEQEKNVVKSHIEACREEFFATVDSLHGDIRGFKYKAAIVFFDFNKAKLTKKALQEIKNFALKYADKPRIYIFSGGHADKVGSLDYNLKLSEKRAIAVKNELIRLGINEDRIKIHAFGKSAPLVNTPDGAREPKNRRVEIMVR